MADYPVCEKKKNSCNTNPKFYLALTMLVVRCPYGCWGSFLGLVETAAGPLFCFFGARVNRSSLDSTSLAFAMLLVLRLFFFGIVVVQRDTFVLILLVPYSVLFFKTWGWCWDI